MVTTRGQSTPSRLGDIHAEETIAIHEPASKKRSRASRDNSHDDSESNTKRQRALKAETPNSIKSRTKKPRSSKAERDDIPTTSDESAQRHSQSGAENISRSVAESCGKTQGQPLRSDDVVDRSSAESDGSSQEFSPVGGEVLRNTRPVVEIPVRSRSPFQPLSTQPKNPAAAMPREESVNGGKSEDEHAVESSDEEEHEVLWLKSPEKRPGKPQGFKHSMNNRPTFSEFTNSTTVESHPAYKRFSSDDPAEHFFSTAPERQESSGESEDDGPEDIAVKKGKGNPDKQHQSSSHSKDLVAKEQLKTLDEKRTFTQGADRADKSERRTRRVRLFHEGIESRLGLDGVGDHDPNLAEEPVSATLQGSGIKPNAANPFKFTKLPDLLPAEYLEESGVKPELLFTQLTPKMGKKTKFTDVPDHKYKDRQVGSTTIRIAEVVKKHLAPKASPQAKSIKEAWLLGRAGKSGTSRKPFKSGFFK